MATDHKNIVYKTVHDMCKAYDISYASFKTRLKKGMSLEQALTEPKQQTTIKDHKGRTYKNMREMCREYHIPVKRFSDRIKSGMSLEQALTEPNKHFKKCKDHLGNEYDSVRGVFFEGNELYPTSGFREKDHIQISIINPNCIKAFFKERLPDKKFKSV